MLRYPDARKEYAAWPTSERRLGAVHLARGKDDLWIASMVAQSGYGPTDDNKPRLRLRALSQALSIARGSGLATACSRTHAFDWYGTGWRWRGQKYATSSSMRS